MNENEALAGWTFADSGTISWTPRGEGVAMKVLGVADGTMIASFQFQPGYVGAVHNHEQAEFTYILEGSLNSQGVMMYPGHSYAVEAGTLHDQFSTETGCTLVSVFKVPGS